MTILGAGKEVLSFCTKCKLNLAHIIASMKDHKTIGKVVCNTCKSTHAYKSTAVKKKTSVSNIVKKRVNESERIVNVWESAMKKNDTKHFPYSTKTKFQMGDVIDHPKFGPGVVDRVFDSNKMEVIFQQDVKTLVHNIAAA